MLTSVLLLADSRLPSGGHGHSGGVEALVERGLLADVNDLTCFLNGRVRTAGLVVGAFAAVAALSRQEWPRWDWERWDAALDVRTTSSALREVSRAQGSALRRTVRLAWPDDPGLRGLDDIDQPHHPLVLGAAVAAAGGGHEQAAALAVHHLVGGAAAAAVRLLGLDPLRVTAAQAGLAPLADDVTAQAASIAARAVADDDPDLLPADTTPMPEIMAELHAAEEVTLFAS